MTKSIKTKALETIEGLTLGDIKPDEKVIENCYKFAHVALARCKNPHTDWGQELEETHKLLKVNGII